VKPDGQFVLGYPRRKPHLEVPHGAYGAIRAPRVSEGRHVVRVRRPLVAEWSLYWLDSKEAAEAKFHEIVDIESVAARQVDRHSSAYSDLNTITLSRTSSCYPEYRRIADESMGGRPHAHNLAFEGRRIRSRLGGHRRMS
jgi:hypothetical protein